MTASQITDYLTRVVQPRLQTIDGVANAQILGGQTFAMRIWLNPDKMAALGITPLDVRTALTANNFVTAAGQVKGDFVQTTHQRRRRCSIIRPRSASWWWRRAATRWSASTTSPPSSSGRKAPIPPRCSTA